jgi:hypothetical protein
MLTGNYTGTMDALADEFAAGHRRQRVRWEPFAYEPLRAASRMIYGIDAVPVHDFSNAEVVITFGADFLETWLSPVDYAHGFVQGRAYSQGRRGKLISVGPHQSLTDMNADEWLPARPGTEHLVALAIARLDRRQRRPGRRRRRPARRRRRRRRASARASRPSGCARSRATSRNGGRSLAVGPGVATTHAAATAVAAAVAVLNQVAGNVGRTVRLEQREEHASNNGSYAEMQQLVAGMRQRRGRRAAGARAEPAVQHAGARGRRRGARRGAVHRVVLVHARRDEREGAPAAAGPPLPGELGRLRAPHRHDRARAAGHDARSSRRSRPATCCSPSRAA